MFKRKAKHMVKRIFSFILIFALIISVTQIGPIISIAATSTPYYNWKQYDSQWSGKYIGDKTIGQVGCVATSLAILIVHSGLRNESNFDPGTFVDLMKSVGGFNNNSISSWSKVGAAVSGFNYKSQISLSGTQSNKISTINSYVSQGYYVVVRVKSGGHYVAARSSTASSVTMMDPGSSATDLFSTYDASGVDQILVYTSTGVPTQPPAAPTVSLSKTLLATGEEATLTWSHCENATLYWIYAEHSTHVEYLSREGKDYSSQVSFDEPGNYRITVSAVNSNGQTTTGNWVDITVYDSKPTAPTVSLSKTILAVGEEATLTWSQCENTTLYWIYAENAIHEEYLTREGTNFSSKVSFDEPGNYTITVTAINNKGQSTGNWVNVTVYDSKPAAPTVSLSKTVLAVGEEATLTWSQCESTTLYWIYAENTIHEEYLSREGTNFSSKVSFGEPGNYTITVTAINNKGQSTGNRVSFLVYDPNVVYSVQYDANGGTGAPSTQTKTYGINLTLSDTKPTRSGYTFTGWNTKADGSGTLYAPGTVYSANSMLTLYAQWSAITLNSIAVKTNPTKTSYNVGDSLSTSGLALTATYSDTSNKTITSGFVCSPTKLTTAGTQVITVTYSGKTTTFNVTVSPILVTGIKLNATSSSIALGATKQLTATASPSNATNKAVTWTSSNTGVATVSSSGLVTAKAVSAR